MSRRGLYDFDKIVHYYEPWIDNKRHKVPIKLRTEDGETVEFYSPYFKDDDDRVIQKFFTKLKDLYSWIDDQLSDLPDVKWEKKIYIKVDGHARGQLDTNEDSYYSSLVSAKIEIYATDIELGTAPDGRRWKRVPGRKRSLERFTKNIGYGLEKEKYYWKKDDPNDPGDPYSRALIDDTPQARELLVNFAVQFDELRDQFFRAMSPDYVHQFLASAGNMKLLSGVEQDKPTKEKGGKTMKKIR